MFVIGREEHYFVQSSTGCAYLQWSLRVLTLSSASAFWPMSVRCAMLQMCRWAMSFNLHPSWVSEDHRLHKAVFQQTLKTPMLNHCAQQICCFLECKLLKRHIRERIARLTHYLLVHSQGQHNSSNTMT